MSRELSSYSNHHLLSTAGVTLFAEELEPIVSRPVVDPVAKHSIYLFDAVIRVFITDAAGDGDTTASGGGAVLFERQVGLVLVKGAFTKFVTANLP